MKNKMKITEENYKEVVLKRSIILCWVLLAICFVIKIFGGNFFAIVCTNEKFVKVCEYVDNSWLNYLIHFIFFNASLFLILRAIDFTSSKGVIMLKLLLCILLWCFKHLLNLGIIRVNVFVSDIVDFVFVFIVSFVLYNKTTKLKTKIFRPIIGLILLFVFTMISALTKSLGLSENLNNSSLLGFIFMIDYYIMIVLYYLYEKRRSLKWENGVYSTGSAKM